MRRCVHLCCNGLTQCSQVADVPSLFAHRHVEQEPQASVSGSAQLDATSLLEVPQNSDATIRLLKARIRALEEQLNMALRAGQGESGEAGKVAASL